MDAQTTPAIAEAPTRRRVAALRHGEEVAARACLVAAHPDDETISAGGRLARFPSLTLVHVTDGAPEDGQDAARAGFPDALSYRRARAAELDRALAALGVAPRRLQLGVADGEAAFHLEDLSRRLAAELRGFEVVLTHAYEGGHPDHDAAAFAVQAACALLRGQGAAAPVRLEFAGYHQAQGARATGRFWPDPAHSAVEAALRGETLARKRAALACFRSQAEIVAWFSPDMEAYRAAPTYDFARPPPPGEVLYDQWGWRLTGARWRDCAAAALRRLELAAWA